MDAFAGYGVPVWLISVFLPVILIILAIAVVAFAIGMWKEKKPKR